MANELNIMVFHILLRALEVYCILRAINRQNHHIQSSDGRVLCFMILQISSRDDLVHYHRDPNKLFDCFIFGALWS